MRQVPTRSLIRCAVAITALLPASPLLHAVETQVGVAAVEITAPLGAPMAGYYHERGADGVLDPLYCKALVIERDDNRMAFVVLDIICVTRAITDRRGRRSKRQQGFPAAT